MTYLGHIQDFLGTAKSSPSDDADEKTEDDDNNNDAPTDNANIDQNNPMFEHKTLQDTPDDFIDTAHVSIPPQGNIRSPSSDIVRQNTPPPQTSAAIPAWTVELKAQNTSLQKAVEVLTTLVTTLKFAVLSQVAEIKNFKLSHVEFSKVKSFKRLMKGPSCKNFRISSSWSTLNDAGRKGENKDKDNDAEDVDNFFDDADYGHFAPGHQQKAPETIVAENIVPENVVVQKDKGKGILIYKETQIPKIPETPIVENVEINNYL
ncbi:hypothetical protein L1987_08533 [Smallanthus sonchifolius]|uniref:Uncharacterized protein n=1 Tax=Smallanthus sonchifolius TaxID=185202 RepID=A0ACB9JNX4_9ASTR|nr:hypothetical protein L1987_08533 [Smallanthus sonchifolius]